MIRLTNPTGRNTKAHCVYIGDRCYFFSYETCVGYTGPGLDGDYKAIRRENVWGPTTGRHMNEMGIRDFHVLPEEEFRRVVEGSL